MWRTALVLLVVVAAACAGDVGGTGATGRAVTGSSLTDVKLTHYTLVTEAETSGQNTGDTTTLCTQPGLSGCFFREFLCSGYGVAMQGTGVSQKGVHIKYVSGGGGWSAGYTWLNDCSSAVFAEVAGVTGASGRMLLEEYSIAVDPGVIPLGSYVWIDTEGHWFRADDTGGAVVGRHIDIYEGTIRGYSGAASSRVFVTSEARDRDDPSPYEVPPPLCPPSQTSCGGTCVDLQTNPAHCGQCELNCATAYPHSANICQQGVCIGCAPGFHNCNAGTPQDSQPGSDGCESIKPCSTGNLQCGAGQTACGSTCANLQTSSSNCGICGHQCAWGQSCKNGTCQSPTPVPNCQGKQCGPDGAGGSCGSCASGQSCDASGKCVAGSCAAPGTFSFCSPAVWRGPTTRIDQAAHACPAATTFWKQGPNGTWLGYSKKYPQASDLFYVICNDVVSIGQ